MIDLDHAMNLCERIHCALALDEAGYGFTPDASDVAELLGEYENLVRAGSTPGEDARAKEILAAELRGSTAEFLGWLTGLTPPSDKESVPPEMRGAFEKMVERLTDAAKRYASALAAPPATKTPGTL